jgi:hypothetical protein
VALGIIAPVITGTQKTRTEKCLECAKGCMQTPIIRELIITKNRIKYVISGVSFVYGLLCGFIAILATIENEQQKILFGSFSASMGVVGMHILLREVTRPIISYILYQMVIHGCACAIYCSNFL